MSLELMRERLNEEARRRRALRDAEAAIGESARRKSRSYIKTGLMLFIAGTLYVALSFFFKHRMDTYISVICYVFSLLAFAASRIVDYRAQKGYYGTTSSEVHEVIAHLLEKQREQNTRQ